MMFGMRTRKSRPNGTAHFPFYCHTCQRDQLYNRCLHCFNKTQRK